MRIASVTLAGPGTEGILGEALRSVFPLVDHVVLAYTAGQSQPASFASAYGADINSTITWLTWKDDFALMRNAALAEAARTECDWALWLDTDERIVCPDPAKLREVLEAHPQVNVVSAFHASGEYAKDRMIRLPRQGKYVGVTHEYYQQDDESIPVLRLPMDLLHFTEIPKDPEAKKRSLIRDVRLLKDYIRKVDDGPRWHYYLGHTYYLLGDKDAAEKAWWESVTCPGDGWEELQAWAAFRAAECVARTTPRGSVSYAFEGLKRYPQMPELYWILGAAYLELGEPSKALTHALTCAGMGQLQRQLPVTRSGFLWPPALTYAPYDIAAIASQAMGLVDQAKQFREVYTQLGGPEK